MALSMGVGDLMQKPQEIYSARASITDGVINPASSTVTGDRNSGLFVPKQDLEKMDFLKLLVAQLQFQDPLTPMENTEFVAQLAQFSALEGNYNIEKAISKLDTSFQQTVDAQSYSAKSMTNASAVSLIGKEVRLAETQVRFYQNAGETVPIRVHLGNNDQAVVEIVDSDGNVVRSLTTSGKDGQNSSVVEWNGMKDNGEFAGSGTYEIRIQGQDADPSLYAFVQDMVEGVRFSSDGPMVKIGGKELSIGNIMDVSIGTQGAGFEGLSPTSAIALLGKTVRVVDDSLTFVNKGQDQVLQPMALTAYLDSLQSGTLEIVNSAGEVVYRETASAGAGGCAEFSWDGRHMETFDFVPSGTYTLRLAEEKYNPRVYLYREGTVDGVSNQADGAQIRVNGKTVPLSSILDISNEQRA